VVFFLIVKNMDKQQEVDFRSKIDAMKHTIYNKLIFSICERISDITKKYGYEISFIIADKNISGDNITSKLIAMLDSISTLDAENMKDEISIFLKSLNNPSLVENIMSKCKKDKL